MLAFLMVSCGVDARPTLRLATTTSTYDSGLLDAILPDFEARVDVLAVGSGQALALGARGDVDVVLVHAPEQEQAFIQAGHGTKRYPVMYNDFVVVGPLDDPASIAGMGCAAEALARIADRGAVFASRGDRSGTHMKEIMLWKAAGLDPRPEQSWYFSLGQGMAATLQFANESIAYTLTDRGTFFAMDRQLPNLRIMVGGESIAENPDAMLRNPYSVIPINPERHAGVDAELGKRFVDWLLSPETQARIGEFGKDRYGGPLFVPAGAGSGGADP